MWFHHSTQVVSREYPCFKSTAARRLVDVGIFGRLPAHEVLGRVRSWMIPVVFGQTPLARVLHRLEAEGAAFRADDEAVVFEFPEEAGHCGFTDVECPDGLPHRVRDAAVVAAVVPLGEFDVERPRVAGQAFPCPCPSRS